MELEQMPPDLEINANDEQKSSDSENSNELCDVEWELILSFLSIKDIRSVDSTCKSFRNMIQKSTYLAHQIISEFVRVSQFPGNPHSAEQVETSVTGDDMDIHVPKPFIIPLFSRICLSRISLFPETPIFQMYSRLLSYNWRIHLVVLRSFNWKIWERIKAFIYGQNLRRSFKLLNVFQNTNLFHFRQLNLYENQIFVKYKSLTQHSNLNVNCNNKLIVDDMDAFIGRLNQYFYYKHWKHFIFDDANKFFLAGGSVFKCVQNLNNDDTEHNIKKMQDLDFFSIHDSKQKFCTKIKKIVSLMDKFGMIVVFQFNTKNENHIQNIYVNFSDNKSVIAKSLIDKDDDEDDEVMFQIAHKVIEEEGFWTDLQFIYIGIYEPWSVLHIFDLDCCQIGFNGKDVLCTYAFLQSMNTQTIINYKLTNNEYLINTIAKRSIKYSNKGFNLICPIQFNIDILKELKKYEWRGKEFMVEQTRRWRDTRYDSLKECSNLHAWFTDHAIQYGDGGFGLNNDYFGVRKIFGNLVSDAISDCVYGVQKNNCVSPSVESVW